VDTYTYSGRSKKPLLKKLNPIWWFQNDDEQTLDQAPWFQPNWPEWQRRLIWNTLRNPLQNFRAYVVGVQDRNYTVVGKAPVTTVQRNDLSPPEQGWQWCIIKLPLPRPFVSYSGSWIAWYAGWQPSGFFGFKLNFV
jgi:hypothetical protein